MILAPVIAVSSGANLLPFLSIVVASFALLVSLLSLLFQHLLYRDEVVCRVSLQSSPQNNDHLFIARVLVSNPGNRMIAIIGGALQQVNRVSEGAFEGLGGEMKTNFQLPITLEKGGMIFLEFPCRISNREAVAFLDKSSVPHTEELELHLRMEFATVDGSPLHLMRRLGSLNAVTKNVRIEGIAPITLSSFSPFGALVVFQRLLESPVRRDRAI